MDDYVSLKCKARLRGSQACKNLFNALCIILNDTCEELSTKGRNILDVVLPGKGLEDGPRVPVADENMVEGHTL